MKIAVIGATGTAGRKVVQQLSAQGHEAVEISRTKGVDVTTGEGQDIGEFLQKATGQIVKASESAGVGHIVYLSITNIDNPEVAKFDYYRAKALQEEALAQGSVPYSIVRSAQWMEFALNPAAVEERDNEVIVSDWYIQPIAVDDVAKTLVEVATGAQHNRTVTGPKAIRLPDLTR